MNGYWVSLSIRDPLTPEKYLGGDDVWNIAESALEEAAIANNLNYKPMLGEAAFMDQNLILCSRTQLVVSGNLRRFSVILINQIDSIFHSRMRK